MSAFKAGVTTDPRNLQVATVSGSGSSAFATDWARFVNTDIVAQVSGSATSITASVQRSDVDPANQAANIAPADATGFTGDPATGIPPNIYTESGVGWWRINVSAVSGGTAFVSLSGIGGPA